MKNIFFGLLVLGFAFLGCRNDEVSGQYIDQVISLYIDSAGQDMLNSEIEGSYSNVTFNDEYGTTDTAPVTFTYAYDEDSVRYIDYVAGATRILIDSSDPENKIYQSKIALRITKPIDDDDSSTFSDTLVLNYSSTPEVFQLQNAWYNNILVFTKTEAGSNIIKVTK